jgi:hypothetical protein
MSDVVFTWEIDLSTLVGRRVSVETVEGITRAGKLVDVRFYDPIEIANRSVSVPKEILIGDDKDPITFTRIRSISMQHRGPSDRG